MSDSSVSIDHWFICDDVRQEINGKTSFIGVYGDTIVVKSLPSRLSQICFVIQMHHKENPPSEIQFRVEPPKSSTDLKGIGPVTIKPPQDEKKKKLGAMVCLAPFEITSSGVYNVYLKINTEKERKIGSYDVIVAS